MTAVYLHRLWIGAQVSTGQLIAQKVLGIKEIFNQHNPEWLIYSQLPEGFGQQRGVFPPWMILVGGIILAIGLGGLLYFAQTAYQKTQKISQINDELQTEIQQRYLAEQDLRKQQELLRIKIHQEQALRRVVGSIRNSLDLHQIFATAVAEIAHLLTTDRADILEYRPQEGLWLTVAAYRCNPTLPDTLGAKIPDRENTIADQLKKLQIVRLGDAIQVDDEINRELARSFPGAWLLIPLHVRGVVWGSLTLARHTRLNSWSDLDEELAMSVAEQLAIAIQQSQLHQQLQAFNTNLERQVHLHTLELQRALTFEATLKRITDKVRDSLDQDQILQTVVKELLDTLEVDCCKAVLCNNSVNNSSGNTNPVNALANHLTNGLTNSANRSVDAVSPRENRASAPPQSRATIAYEATQVGVSSHWGNNLSMADLPDIYHQLEQGQSTAFCLLKSGLIRHDYAMLACPIIDDHGLLGELWLFKPPLSSFGDMEIRLLKQVANQCAIAIRQAQLYQAAQKQVTELERLNLLKDDFLSTISHELRTPISSIKIATDMIEILIGNLGGFQGDLKALEAYVQILQDESLREEKLINDLLDLTCLESGTEPLRLIPIKLQYWIPYITDTFVERAKSQQQQLFIEIPQDFPEVTTDVSILERIIIELLNNACKYTPAGEFILFTATLVQPLQGRIEQFSSQDQPHACICVVNSGVEIPAEELERIFDKFYRIPNRDPWRYGGTGLGLALVRRLAQYLGATIEVESNFGRTCFTVDLGNLYPEEPE
ncbi:MAG: GAF domain-containing sensor histidine kinase [Coleofasciculaceae cyanobacterium SM2_1_6]|nr:GAF domain-containing sensor histidine kinase [Coleofasciculaceae cyanobacterium SM2_1_6]